MKYIDITNPIKIIGIKNRTGGKKAEEDLSLLWKRFFSEEILDKIPNKVSKDIYGIYTDFDDGSFTFIIGAQVENFDDVPKEFYTSEIIKSNYQVFSAGTKPQEVGAKWKEVWGYDFEKPRTFVLEFEKYYENGNIDIFIGVK